MVVSDTFLSCSKKPERLSLANRSLPHIRQHLRTRVHKYVYDVNANWMMLDGDGLVDVKKRNIVR